MEDCVAFQPIRRIVTCYVPCIARNEVCYWFMLIFLPDVAYAGASGCADDMAVQSEIYNKISRCLFFFLQIFRQGERVFLTVLSGL